ncbi:hypothetical protein U5922_007035 [Aquicoccus sp. G2-2]|uniref:hypothetical protein n=1 Tax=Aquicoccus sp. G2-2 TaxID=3092120 RepID=UPI002ADF8F73|nr:hypothetical protein [Aquicoccus sp. G2-2]MEA1113241.1 hypothetical protein [Aquicoccus sp. G2-2]
MSGPDHQAGGPRAISSHGGRAGPVFLEQAGYRRRRLIDAVRLVPLLGAGLWAVPLLWTPGKINSSAAFLYVFGVWLMLVIATAVLAQAFRGRGVQAESRAPEEVDTPTPPGGRDAD